MNVQYEDEPALIKGVREKPNSVILFDEIEKAHKAVQKVLLNILDSGEMQDNKGNRVSFKNTIIIFTTNLGCTKDTGKTTGMGFIKTKNSNEAGRTEVIKAIEDYFSPEFLGRLDDIVYFNTLTNNIIKTLIDRYLTEYNRAGDVSVVFTDEDIQNIIKTADIETRGARGVRKAVRKQMVEVLNREEDLAHATDF